MELIPDFYLLYVYCHPAIIPVFDTFIYMERKGNDGEERGNWKGCEPDLKPMQWHGFDLHYLFKQSQMIAGGAAVVSEEKKYGFVNQYII